MMIRTTCKRTRGAEPPFDPLVSDRTIGKALELLVGCELGFGGTITVLEPTRVETVTQVMGCIDTTVFEGSVEDMALLVEASVVHLELMSRSERVYDDKLIDLVMHITKGIPRMIEMAGAHIIGSRKARVVWLVLLGCTTKEQAERCMNLSMDDLGAMVVMTRIEGLPLDDVMALAA